MKIEAVPIPPLKKVISEKDFDLETWRKEVPIDYYVMARLLTVSDHPVVRTELFKTVYQAVQLHIPNTLYKYISLADSTTSNEKRFDALAKNRLFLSEVTSLNDPFDCKAYYYDPNALLKYEELKPHNGRIINDFSSMFRVASLTANGVQSLPMWAHYANNHAGFCVSYDMTDRENLSLKSCSFPVFYTDDRLDITSVMDSFISTVKTEIKAQSAAGKKEIRIDDFSVAFLASLLCNVKHSSWSYENEYRCTEGATAPGIPFIDAKAKKIYVGLHCKDEHIKRLREIGRALGIPVYKMTFDECSEGYQLSVKQFT